MGAPALSLFGYGLDVAATGASLGFAGGPLPVVYLTLFVYVLLLRGGFGEELGWRGYALPHLAEWYTTTVAALLVGTDPGTTRSAQPRIGPLAGVQSGDVNER